MGKQISRQPCSSSLLEKVFSYSLFFHEIFYVDSFSVVVKRNIGDIEIFFFVLNGSKSMEFSRIFNLRSTYKVFRLSIAIVRFVED